MMSEKEIALEFYQNGSAQSALERFNFSEKEEKLIRDAIRTASMLNPRMKLITEADALLKEVAVSREPILPTEKTEVSAEAIAQLELLKFNSAKREDEQAFMDKMPMFFGFKSKHGILFVILMAVGLIIAQYFQTKPLNDAMKKQENLMHGIINK